jgi:hypothetical protein
MFQFYVTIFVLLRAFGMTGRHGAAPADAWSTSAISPMYRLHDQDAPPDVG